MDIHLTFLAVFESHAHQMCWYNLPNLFWVLRGTFWPWLAPFLWLLVVWSRCAVRRWLLTTSLENPIGWVTKKYKKTHFLDSAFLRACHRKSNSRHQSSVVNTLKFQFLIGAELIYKVRIFFFKKDACKRIRCITGSGLMT